MTSSPPFHADFWAAMAATAPVLALAYGLRIDRTLQDVRVVVEAGHPTVARAMGVVVLAVLFFCGAVLPAITFFYAFTALSTASDVVHVPHWMIWVDFRGATSGQSMAAAGGAAMLSGGALLGYPFVDAIGDLLEMRRKQDAPPEDRRIERVTVVRRSLFGTTTTTTEWAVGEAEQSAG